MKATWFVLIIIISIALVGCQAPAVDVDATPNPTMVMTPAPTATPMAEPPKVWDTKACEERLETLIQQDVTFDQIMPKYEAYCFIAGQEEYLVGIYDGDVKMIIHHIEELEPTGDIDLEKAKKLVYDEAKMVAPSFFDYEILEECSLFEWYARIYLYQLSPRGNRTGNVICGQVENYGVIQFLTVHNTEDIAVADQPVNIDEARAIALVYEAAKAHTLSLQEEWLENAPEDVDPYEVYLDDWENHEVEVTLTVWKGKKVYHVSIDNVATNQISQPDMGMRTMGFLIAIDAMTGEIIHIGHSC